MKYRWIFGLLFLLLHRTALAEESSSDFMRLIKPTFSFQLCVRNTTEAEITRLVDYKGSGTDLEDILWKSIINKCQAKLNDEAKGLILLYYGGNRDAAKGFYDGLVIYARAYVISRSVDVTGN